MRWWLAPESSTMQEQIQYPTTKKIDLSTDAPIVANPLVITNELSTKNNIIDGFNELLMELLTEFP